MSDAVPPLPVAVVLIRAVPGLEHAKGHLLTDAETIAHIYENGLQRNVVPVDAEYADAHAVKQER